MADETDSKLLEEALTDCAEKVEELKEENAHLRNAAETFGELAERLNSGRRGGSDRRKTLRTEEGGKSLPDNGLPH